MQLWPGTSSAQRLAVRSTSGLCSLPGSRSSRTPSAKLASIVVTHTSSSDHLLVLHGIDDQQKNVYLDMSDRLCSACETSSTRMCRKPSTSFARFLRILAWEQRWRFCGLHAAWDMWVLPFLNPPVGVPTLVVIWVRNVGISMDVYVYRTTHWLKRSSGTNHPPTKTPEETGERMIDDHSFVSHLAPFFSGHDPSSTVLSSRIDPCSGPFLTNPRAPTASFHLHLFLVLTRDVQLLAQPPLTQTLWPSSTLRRSGDRPLRCNHLRSLSKRS